MTKNWISDQFLKPILAKRRNLTNSDQNSFQFDEKLATYWPKCGQNITFWPFLDQHVVKISNFGHFWQAKIIQNSILDQLISLEWHNFSVKPTFVFISQEMQCWFDKKFVKMWKVIRVVVWFDGIFLSNQLLSLYHKK